MPNSIEPVLRPTPINRRRLIRSLLSFPLFFALCMFLPAGTWAWPKGWLFILVVLVSGSLATAYLARANPEVIAARVNAHQGTKLWDKVLLGFFFLSFFATFIVAALNDRRFHWLPMPWPICILGYALLLAGLAITTWAEGANKFFEPTVRIQTDRGQTVVETGPYAIVRHPGYVGGVLVFIGVALSLGSFWALIPAGLAGLLLVLRTHWEDQTLQRELPGYMAYAARVGYKWIPGVW